MSDTITLPRAELEQALEALENPHAGLVPHNGEWRSIQEVAISALRARLRCPACQGNDADAPCAYPSEGKPGCWRDKRLAQKQKAEPVAWIYRGTLMGDVIHTQRLDHFHRDPIDEHRYIKGIPLYAHPPRQELSEEVRSLLTKHVPKLAELMRMPNAEWAADEHNAAVAALRAIERKVRG